jgi:hypothetical protein
MQQEVKTASVYSSSYVLGELFNFSTEYDSCSSFLIPVEAIKVDFLSARRRSRNSTDVSSVTRNMYVLSRLTLYKKNWFL